MKKKGKKKSSESWHKVSSANEQVIDYLAEIVPKRKALFSSMKQGVAPFVKFMIPQAL